MDNEAANIERAREIAAAVCENWEIKHPGMEFSICQQAALSTQQDRVKALEDALWNILKVRVDKHADNIWTGLNKCKAIANTALAGETP